MNEETFDIKFSDTQIARAIRVHSEDELSAVLRKIGLVAPRPVLVLTGGAGGMSEPELLRLRPLFTQALAPLAQELTAVVVAGGTDAGVMQLMGQARHATNGTFPWIGVPAIGTIVLPGDAPSPNTWTLETHCSHFVLVPGKNWGDESPWISRVASRLANGAASVTVLINGGKIAWDDVAESVKANRPVVVVAGSGRAADVLANALRGSPTDDRTRKLIATGLVQAIDTIEEPGRLAARVAQILNAQK